MRKSRFIDSQIIDVVKRLEAGVGVQQFYIGLPLVIGNDID